MKSAVHAVAGVLGFVLAGSFVVATLAAAFLVTPELRTSLHAGVLGGMLPLLLCLLGAGATGMSLLGTRKAPLGLTKQLRGPRAFMTTLLVLLPTSAVLWYWSSTDAVYYGALALNVVASAFVLLNVGLNIRDGLALRGRIRAAGARSPSIAPRDGGPLVVTAVPALTGGDGQALPTGSVVALCRCGRSGTKPFCDGSHNSGFDSSPSEDRTKDAILTYEGREATIHYNRLLCSHAAECGRRQKAAFDSSRTPWIVPDNASLEGLAEVVRACPSGALRLSRPGDEPTFSHSDATGIVVEKDGPYRVTRIPLDDARLAQGADPDKYVLCRCGASKNKPFCDGSHADIGWSDG